VKGSEEMEKQYTVMQVVNLTGYSERTIRDWIKKEIIKSQRTMTNRVRIPESEVKKIIGKVE